jgi:uncharacterized membrane protein YedE/YeeE
MTMHNFTPLSGLLGGALIGLAAAMLMLLTGRLAGVSGIAGGLLSPASDKAFSDKTWRIAFITGLIAAALLMPLFGGPSAARPASASLVLFAVAGLLVGFGSRMGNGCTSGHGVCGFARLSARSIVATVVFMGVAVATVAIVRHGFGG